MDDEVPGMGETGSTFRAVGSGSYVAGLPPRSRTRRSIARLDGAIEEAVKLAPPQMRAVIEALQALRGIAHVSAVTVAAELGEMSRVAGAKQLS